MPKAIRKLTLTMVCLELCCHELGIPFPMISGDFQLVLGLLDFASCFICLLKWGLVHRKSTIKNCVEPMKNIERKRQKKQGGARS